MLAADPAQDVVVGSTDRIHAVVVDHGVLARPPCGVGVRLWEVEIQRRDAVGVRTDASAATHVVDAVRPTCVMCGALSMAWTFVDGVETKARCQHQRRDRRRAGGTARASPPAPSPQLDNGCRSRQEQDPVELLLRLHLN